MDTYRVAGGRRVFGYAPGEEFEKELTAEQEAYYIGAGHLVKVTAPATKADGMSKPKGVS